MPSVLRARAALALAGAAWAGVAAAQDLPPVAAASTLLGPSAEWLKTGEDHSWALFGSTREGECNQRPGEQNQFRDDLFDPMVIESADPLPDATTFAEARNSLKPLLLYPVINQYPVRNPGLFVFRRCGTLLVRVDDLKSWRIVTDNIPFILLNGVPFIDVGHYPGLRYTLDEVAQKITIEGEPFIFTPLVLDFDRTEYPKPSPQLAGLFANWSVSNGGVLKDPSQILLGSIDVGAFHEVGTFLNSFVWGYDFENGKGAFNRAASTFIRDVPQHAARLYLGDVQSQGSPMVGAPALGGIAYGSDLSMQPGRITTPVADYDFGLRRQNHTNIGPGNYFPLANERPGSIFNTFGNTLPYGPIALRNVPVSGNAQYYFDYTDINQQRNVYSDGVFFNQGLTRQGLYQYYYAFGLIRGGAEARRGSDTYETLAFTMTHRYGFNAWLTGVGHLQASQERQAASGNLLVAVPYLGVVSLGLAQSWSDQASNDNSQRRYLFGFANSWRKFGYSFQRLVTNGGFRAVQSGITPSSISDYNSASFYYSLPWRDSIIFRYVDSESRGPFPAQRFLDAEYTLNQFRRVRVRLYAHHEYANGADTTYGISISSTTTLQKLWDAVTPDKYHGQNNKPSDYRSGGLFSPANTTIGYGIDSDFKRIGGGISLGTGETIGRHSLGLSINQTGLYQDRYLTQPFTAALSYNYNSPYFTDYAQISYTNNIASYSAGAQGGFLLIGDKFRFTRPVFGSFALVHLGKDLAGATVSGSVADKDGDAIVVGLSPYTENTLYVDLDSIPLNLQDSQLKSIVVPKALSASEVNMQMPVVIDGMVHVQIRNPDGSLGPAPPGAYAVLKSRDGEQAPEDGERFPAGVDGAFYLSGLGRDNSVRVFWYGHSCALNVQVDEKQAPDSVAELGTYVCEE